MPNIDKHLAEIFPAVNPSEESIADEKGKITVKCNCGKTLKVPKFRAGKNIICPICRNVTTVPSISEKLETPLFETESNDEEIVDKVLAELNKTDLDQKKSIGKNLATLAVSVVLFISLGLFRNSIASIAMLVGVILIHECGHFIGMKLLKYKDVQMFFIPLFGAAVSGKETTPSEAKKAIVSLFGPAPGILIGIGTGVAYFLTRQPLLADATRIFIFLNTFNLLPFHPLDGSRIFDALLFSRHPRIEVGFKIITTLILGWLAFIFRDIFFGLFAGAVFISIRSTHISASIAHEIRKETNAADDCSLHKVPPESVQKIVKLLKEKLPAEHRKPKPMAIFTNGIWQRVCNKPCAVIPSIGLLTCYAFFILLGGGAGILFEVTTRTITNSNTKLVTQALPNGKTMHTYIVSLRGQSISETQVNDDGLFHGTQTDWYISTTNKSKEGHWQDGYWDGEWKYWDIGGTLVEIVEYNIGKPVQCQQLIDGVMQDVPYEEWPQSIKRMAQNQPQGIKRSESNSE